MKSWKNRLKDEIDKIVPELSDEVKNAPIPVNYETMDNGGNTVALIRKKPVIITATAIFLALLCAIIACIYIFKPKNGDIFMFTVEINPAVCIVTDGDGKVTGVSSVNVDADVILSADGIKQNIIGKTADEAIVFYTDLAARLGYIDFSGYNSAMRVSVCGSKDAQKLLNKTHIALKDYFTNKGVFVAVLTESVSKDELAVRGDVPHALPVADMADLVFNRKTLYADREAEGASIEEIRAFYRETVLKNGLVDIVGNSLKDNIEKLKANAADIQRLFGLYQEIYSHEDNPAMLLKDYWEVKKYYGDALTGEFALLINEMDAALIKYEADYGVKITSSAELLEAVRSYASISFEQLSAFLENFSFELFEKFSAELSEIIKITGILPDSVLWLLELPETVGEYSAKMLSALSSEYAVRTENYADIYSMPREPLTTESYEGFISAIEEKYGSLEDYWDNLKN